MTVHRKRPRNSGYITVGVSGPDGFYPLVSGIPSQAAPTKDLNAEAVSNFLFHQSKWEPSITMSATSRSERRRR